jgi:hypothetical protein
VAGCAAKGSSNIRVHRFYTATVPSEKCIDYSKIKYVGFGRGMLNSKLELDLHSAPDDLGMTVLTSSKNVVRQCLFCFHQCRLFASDYISSESSENGEGEEEETHALLQRNQGCRARWCVLLPVI